MKKLEDIPKSNPFSTPEGYFERLPGVIQSRVAVKHKPAVNVLSWGFALKYALPVVALITVGIFWFRPQPTGNLEHELEQVHPEQLSVFLNETDVTTEEIVETVNWSSEDLDELESDVYANLKDVSSQEIGEMMDNYDVEL